MAQIIVFVLCGIFVIRLGVFFIQCSRWIVRTRTWRASEEFKRITAEESIAFARLEWAFDLRQIYNPMLWSLYDFVDPTNSEEFYVFEAILIHYKKK